MTRSKERNERAIKTQEEGTRAGRKEAKEKREGERTRRKDRGRLLSKSEAEEFE